MTDRHVEDRDFERVRLRFQTSSLVALAAGGPSRGAVDEDRGVIVSTEVEPDV